MTRIDFYILAEDSSDNRLRTACRIAEKAFSKRLATHIHTDSEQDSHKIDTLLWTFREHSFLPHKLGVVQSDALEITIGHSNGNNASPDAIPQHSDVLINLAAQVPMFFSSFDRVAEIIDQNTEMRDSGRERYRFYKDRGYPLTHHQL